MVIEPFNYQKRTNIEEHNQIVDKLNEVVDAVNNIDPNPSEFEQRIDALELSAINQQNAIEGIHTRDALQDTTIQRAEDNISQLERNVQGVTENVSGLTGQVAQLETDTTNLDGRVTDLNGRLTTLAGNQTALEGRVDSINTEVGQLSTKTGALETGKVNVAQGTENGGKYLRVGPDGNVKPATFVESFTVTQTMTVGFPTTGIQPYGDYLYRGDTGGTFKYPEGNYLITVEFTADADKDIDWYATQNEGDGFTVVFDRLPTADVNVTIQGIEIR